MNNALLSSGKMDWRTPKDFFRELDQEFHFGLDAAATPENAKRNCFFTPEMNGLSLPWSGYGAVFCNSPYGREIGKWVQRAYSEHVCGGVTIVMLIPVDTDYTMDIYIMVFNALKEAEKKRIAEKKGGRKATHDT